MIYFKIMFWIISVACIAFAVFNIWDFLNFCKNAFLMLWDWLKGLNK